MKIPLNKAPFNKPLSLEKVSDDYLLRKFEHLGLYQNDIITRLDEDILIRPVKIETSSGMIIIGAGMGSKIVAHLDDGRKIPIAELRKGETGHIEGIIGGTKLAKSLETLGLKNDDKITFIRSIPPMEYSVIINSTKRVRIGEGVASKIWGSTDDGKKTQFSSSSKGKKFLVEKVLGGKKALDVVAMHGDIKPGAILVLEGVKPTETLAMATGHKHNNPVIITNKDGLRLIIERSKCRSIFVCTSQD